MKLRSGALNRLIDIRSPSTWTRSTDGQPIMTWSTIATGVWADRIPLTAREMFRADVRWEEVRTKFVIRHTTVAITPQCRLIDLADSSAEYDIKEIIDIDDQQKAYELLVSKVT